MTLWGPAATPVSAQQPALITNAIGALARRDLHQAQELFDQATVGGQGRVASTAERWLGHLAWKVNGDTAAAEAHLDRALRAGGDTSMIQLERARLFAFERNFLEAIPAAGAIMHYSPDGERRGLAARDVVDMSMENAFGLLRGKGSLENSQVEVLGEAIDTLRARVQRFPGRTADALALIEAGALVGGDVATARQGWDSYFLLADDSTRSAVKRLKCGGDREGFARCLAATGLYEPAAILLEFRREVERKEPNWRDADIARYGAFVHDVRTAAANTYRRELIGTARPGDLQRTMNALTRKLWSQLHWPGPTPRYYPAAVPVELAKRFGAVISTDDDEGLSQLRFSHVVASFTRRDRARHVAPRFVVLDGVVSNGLDPWLLEGGSGRAGWVSGDSIYEIRTSFTEQPFREWMVLADSQRASVERARVEREAAADIERAHHDSAAYLPGVALRLFDEGSRQVLDSLSRGGMSPSERQNAFTSIMFHQLNETTIDLHETRHFIDAHATRPQVPIELAELRAKIDEVTGSRRPRLALTAILHPNIGDATAHGRANHRVMLGLIRWMRANAATIRGFDPGLPVLVQLPLLTDNQLRAAFESMRTAG